MAFTYEPEGTKISKYYQENVNAKHIEMTFTETSAEKEP